MLSVAILSHGAPIAAPRIAVSQPVLDADEFARFASDWGRWLRDQNDCKPERAGCNSLESDWKSPQRWHDEKPLFYTDYNVLRAQVFEEVANSGILDWVQKRILDTHHVHLAWWWFVEHGIPEEQWRRTRMRHARAASQADYDEHLYQAETLMRRALMPHRGMV